MAQTTTNLNAKTSGKTTSRFSAHDIVYIALFTAVIAICSQISIPFGPVPFTLQTLGVFVTASILGGKRGTFCVIIYLLLGLIGVPVFAGFSGGPSSIVAPAFGYILGFILTALVVGISTDHFGNRIVPMVISMIVGLFLCYVVGTIWFMLVYRMQGNGIGVATALSYCVIPFLIPDACKIAVSVALSNRLKKIIRL